MGWLGWLGWLGRLGGRKGAGELPRARALDEAVLAERRGDLARAAMLFAEAGRAEDASRVLVLRGDSETDAAARLSIYGQAAAASPRDGPSGGLARRKRAELLLAMSADAPLTATLRLDLREAAVELEAAGLHALAAQAWGRVGDGEAQARALAEAGDVDRLDVLLAEAADRDRRAHEAHERQARIDQLVATGGRREALELARAAGDRGALVDRLEARRVRGDVVRLTLRGVPLTLVLGDEVVVGRSATLSIASAAVSRHHLEVARRGADVVLRDLGTRNGTTLRGLALGGEIVVGEGVEVKLGGEVPLLVEPSHALAGALALTVGGETWTAPLGPAALGVGAWTLERGADGWVELATRGGPTAFSRGLSLEPRIELLEGDALASERDGDALVVVAGAGARDRQRG